MLPSGPLPRFASWVGRSMPGFWRAWGTEAHRSAFPGHWEALEWRPGRRWALMRAEGVGAAYLVDATDRVLGERIFEPIQLASPRKAVAAWLRQGLRGGPQLWASPSGHLSADALVYEGQFGSERVRRVALRVPSSLDRFPPQEELWLVEASQGPADSFGLVAGLEQEARSRILELAMRPPRPATEGSD